MPFVADVPLLLLLPLGASRQKRLGVICAAAVLAGLVIILIALVQYKMSDAGQDVLAWNLFPWLVSFGSGAAVLLLFFWIAPFEGIPSSWHSAPPRSPSPV